MDMSKTAILVDGGFYRKRATHLWGKHTPEEAASALFSYCMRHLSERKHQHELYRIFTMIALLSKSKCIIRYSERQ